jgi:orotidine-5'-phosphate decarboxylase
VDTKSIAQRIFVALDTPSMHIAWRIVQELADLGVRFKIGLELQTAILAGCLGGSAQEAWFSYDLGLLLHHLNFKNVFWDGKWNDIPNTVGGAADAIWPLSPAYINVHVTTSLDSIKSVVKNKGTSKVLGVTVLTSIGEDECVRLFGLPKDEVILTHLDTLVEAGVDGVICSPQELSLKSQRPEYSNLEWVTPGVRPTWAVSNDQMRVMTPAEAIRAGATALVIGRPITLPPSGTRLDAVRRIIEEIGRVL